MADEVHPRETTIIHEMRSGGAAGWAIALVLILALVGAVWFFLQSNRSEVAKDNAVTAAASNTANNANR